MAIVTNGVEILPKISIAWVGCTNVTNRRQPTDRRQTDGRRHIANAKNSVLRGLHTTKITISPPWSPAPSSREACGVRCHSWVIHADRSCLFIEPDLFSEFKQSDVVQKWMRLSSPFVVLLYYNPPYTVPFRRRFVFRSVMHSDHHRVGPLAVLRSLTIVVANPIWHLHRIITR